VSTPVRLDTIPALRLTSEAPASEPSTISWTRHVLLVTTAIVTVVRHSWPYEVSTLGQLTDPPGDP
jgi:hypothetical protein